MGRTIRQRSAVLNPLPSHSPRGRTPPIILGAGETAGTKDTTHQTTPCSVDEKAPPLMTRPDLLAYAARLHRHGITPLPTRSDGTKAPAVKWREWTTTRPGPNELKTWFAPGNTDGIGMLTGTPSGGITMLEIEGRAIDLIDPIAARMTERGLADLWARINNGWVERSPSGGIHWHYRTSRPRPNTKLARRPGSVPGAVDVLIETRGEGGFTILAPSNGRTHPTGQRWELLRGGPNTTPTITANEQDLLFAVLAEFDQTPTVNTPAAPPPRTTTATPGTGLRPGDDYAAQHTWDDILTPHGWTKGAPMGAGHTWTRPGKNTRDGISATTGQADDGVDRLYVFTTSTEFEACRPYGKFAAYAVLNGYGNDLAAAARDLAQQGYGQRQQAAPKPAAHHTPPPPTPPAASINEPDQAPAVDDEPAAWAAINLQPHLDGTHQPVTPTLLPRADGVCLLYPGLVHSLHGESESGKSLVLQLETIRLINHGHDVLYIDFESDPASITERLTTFGASPTAITNHFHYINPDVSPNATPNDIQAWTNMLARPYTLAVIDGVTDSLGVFGLSTKDNDDIARWQRILPKQVARATGAAVAVIDHVVKDVEARGRFAIGGQAKMAGLTGAGYTVEIIQPLGRGIRGIIALRVGKDRPGHIRGHAGPFRKTDRTQEAARIIIDSTTNPPAVTIEPPTQTADTNETTARPFRLTGLMEKISRYIEQSTQPPTQRQINLAITGKESVQKNVTAAINTLITEGWISVHEGPRNSTLHASINPYRQKQDPQSDMYSPPAGAAADAGDGTPNQRLSHCRSSVVPVSSNDSQIECLSVSTPLGGRDTETLKPPPTDTRLSSTPQHPPRDPRHPPRTTVRYIDGDYRTINLETGETEQ